MIRLKYLRLAVGILVLAVVIVLTIGCQNQPTGPVFTDETFGGEASKLRPPEWWEGGGWVSTTTAAAATTTWGGWSSTTTTAAAATTTWGGWSSTTTTSGGYTTTTAAATTTSGGSSWWNGGWWGSTTTTSGGYTTTTSGGVTRINWNQVLLIGNSYIAMSHQITRDLEQFAKNAGILASGDNFIDNSEIAARLSGGSVKTIPQQYADGNRGKQVRWVIMEGGGNDLEESCNPPRPSCPNLQNAVNALRDLLTEMGSDGVIKVIYFFYPDPQGLDELKAQLDVLRPLIQDVVNSSREPVCYWLDLRPVFQGHYSEYVQPDGTHPTSAGSRAAAEAIWDIIERNNFFSTN
jgi:lysophospholipase L1-like esterase